MFETSIITGDTRVTGERGEQNISVRIAEVLSTRKPAQLAEGGATYVKDMDAFVDLVQDLLSIFPNGDRAIQVLDLTHPTASVNDMRTVLRVVPQLRKMLRNTPRELRRDEIRKAVAGRQRALKVLAEAVDAAGQAFQRLINAFA